MNSTRLVFLLAAIAHSGALTAGDLTDRFNLTLDRVLHRGTPRYDRDLLLADVIPRHERRFSNFSGDVSGRYAGALAAVAAHSGQRAPDLDGIVTSILEHQKPDGHFGEPLQPGRVNNGVMALLWGNGRLLIGLLEYYRVNPRQDVLAACRRLGDFLIETAPLLNSEPVRREYNGDKYYVGYICWTQNIEGVVELYRVTNEPRYLELARELAARTDRQPAQHSHGFLSSLRGVLELYKVTTDKRYLTQVETDWQAIAGSPDLLVQGGVPEVFAPKIKRDEGCSEADWLLLNLELWRVTRNQRYLDQAETTLFNEFSMNQLRAGDFSSLTFSDRGIATSAVRAWWCCTLHGLRTLALLFRQAFHDRQGALSYDLPIDGLGEANGLAVRADSQLQRDGTVLLRIARSPGTVQELSIRRPYWAKNVTVSLKGQRLAPVLEDSRLRLRRQWKAGETVAVRYEMRTRLDARTNDGKVAIFHGPWLLGIDRQSSPNYFDDPAPHNGALLPATGTDRELTLEPATDATGPAGRFAVPVARFRLPYLPGGHRMQPAVALLKPIAEHTDGEDFNPLEFWIPTKPGKEKVDLP